MIDQCRGCLLSDYHRPQVGDMTMSFKDLKVGNRVDRYHGSGFFMEMEVVGFGDNLLVCAAVQPGGGLFMGGWTFDMATGAEVDIDLEWGPKWGKTGTYLKEKS